MKISVKVKPNAKKEKVEKIGDSAFAVWVKAPAHEGKANEAVVELFSKYLDRPKSSIYIIRGHKGKEKVLEIGDTTR